MDEIVRGAGGYAVLRNYDADGNPADVDGTNDPTVTVTDSSGTAVPGLTAQRTAVGVYRLTVPATLQTLDVYDVLWSWANGQSRRSRFEVVGAVLFELAALRASDPVLADQTAYPAETLAEVRRAVSERFEEWAEVAFRPRGARDRLEADGSSLLVLARSKVRRLISVSVDGSALPSAEVDSLLVFPAGLIRRPDQPWPRGSIVEVHYEHGYAEPPAPVRRAAMRYARHLLVSGGYDDRATAMVTDVGSFRLTIAGRDGPTGLPEVDAVLADHSHRLPAVG